MRGQQACNVAFTPELDCVTGRRFQGHSKCSTLFHLVFTEYSLISENSQIQASQHGLDVLSCCSPSDVPKWPETKRLMCRLVYVQLQRWVKAAMERPSVTGTFKAPEEGASYEDKLLEHYVRYADGSANSTSAAAFK